MNSSSNDILQIKLDWLFIADNYKKIGQKLRAYEVVKDLVSYSGDTDDPLALKTRYEYHLAEWKKFSGDISANDDSAKAV